MKVIDALVKILIKNMEKTKGKDLMPDILKLLGVELGEIFYIQDFEDVVREDPYAFFMIKGSQRIALFSWTLLANGEYGWFQYNDAVFKGLIHGWNKIIKKEEARDDQ